MFAIGVSQSTNLYFKIIPLSEDELASRKGDIYETTVPFPTQEKVTNPQSSICPYSDFLKREKYYIAAKKKAQHSVHMNPHLTNNNQKEKEEQVPPLYWSCGDYIGFCCNTVAADCQYNLAFLVLLKSVLTQIDRIIEHDGFYCSVASENYRRKSYFWPIQHLQCAFLNP
jgi:hypothetical protein